MMKRWVVRNFTGPEGLEIEEDVPMPELGPNDVLVKRTSKNHQFLKDWEVKERKEEP